MQTFSDKLIDAMGGTSVVSRFTKAAASTVHSWRAKGLSESRLDHLKLIAEREGIAIDWETGERIEHEAGDTTCLAAESPGNGTHITAEAVA